MHTPGAFGTRAIGLSADVVDLFADNGYRPVPSVPSGHLAAS